MATIRVNAAVYDDVSITFPDDYVHPAAGTKGTVAITVGDRVYRFHTADGSGDLVRLADGAQVNLKYTKDGATPTAPAGSHPLFIMTPGQIWQFDPATSTLSPANLTDAEGNIETGRYMAREAAGVDAFSDMVIDGNTLKLIGVREAAAGLQGFFGRPTSAMMNAAYSQNSIVSVFKRTGGFSAPPVQMLSAPLPANTSGKLRFAQFNLTQARMRLFDSPLIGHYPTATIIPQSIITAYEGGEWPNIAILNAWDVSYRMSADVAVGRLPNRPKFTRANKRSATTLSAIAKLPGGNAVFLAEQGDPRLTGARFIRMKTPDSLPINAQSASGIIIGTGSGVKGIAYHAGHLYLITATGGQVGTASLPNAGTKEPVFTTPLTTFNNVQASPIPPWDRRRSVAGRVAGTMRLRLWRAPLDANKIAAIVREVGTRSAYNLTTTPSTNPNRLKFTLVADQPLPTYQDYWGRRSRDDRAENWRDMFIRNTSENAPVRVDMQADWFNGGLTPPATTYHSLADHNYICAGGYKAVGDGVVG